MAKKSTSQVKQSRAKCFQDTPEVTESLARTSGHGPAKSAREHRTIETAETSREEVGAAAGRRPPLSPAEFTWYEIAVRAEQAVAVFDPDAEVHALDAEPRFDAALAVLEDAVGNLPRLGVPWKAAERVQISVTNVRRDWQLRRPAITEGRDYAVNEWQVFVEQGHSLARQVVGHLKRVCVEVEQLTAAAARTRQIRELAALAVAIPAVDRARFVTELLFRGRVSREPVTVGRGTSVADRRMAELAAALRLDLSRLLPDEAPGGIEREVSRRLAGLPPAYASWRRVERGLIAAAADPAVARFRNFTLTPLQYEILRRLDGEPATKADLLSAGFAVSGASLYQTGKPGGLWELCEFGLVRNDRRRGGYYRLDSPPTASTVPRRADR